MIVKMRAEKYPVMIEKEFNSCGNERAPIFRKALMPFLVFLRIFGLFYDFSTNCPLAKRLQYLVRFYCYFLVLVRFTWSLLTAIENHYYCKYKINPFVTALMDSSKSLVMFLPKGNFDDSYVREEIFRQSLRPIVLFAKFFGIFYDISDNCNCSKTLRKLNKFYCFLILFVQFAWLAKSIAGLFNLSDQNELYVCLLYLAFYIKCLAQGFACLQLSPASCSCRLWDFIEELEKFLSDIKLKNCHILEAKFIKRLRIWLYVFVVICVTNAIVQGIMLTNHTVVSSQQLYNMTKAVLEPLPMNNGIIMLTILINALCFGAWFLPAALCGVLSQCVGYTYDELYRYIESATSNCPKQNIANEDHALCLRTHIRYVRLKYVKLGRLVRKLDEMVKYIYLLSFLFDIVLICVILRVVIYTFDEIAPRIFFCVWIIPPLFTLVALSHYSSKIVEKAEQMHEFVQEFHADGINNDIQAELQMLMFQLSSQPVVMTIFGMVPLYKSIIISIFVSIVTYFALMISL